jgi:hypothetical protein
MQEIQNKGQTHLFRQQYLEFLTKMHPHSNDQATMQMDETQMAKSLPASLPRRAQRLGSQQYVVGSGFGTMLDSKIKSLPQKGG